MTTGGDMATGKLIFWLDELCKEQSEVVGKKCANLGELTRAGFTVPPGFALTVKAYEEFLTATGVIHEVQRYFTTFVADPNNPQDMIKYVEASKIIRSIVESKVVPENIKDSLTQYYNELCQKTGCRNVAVATRSAGPASHPGQYETFLNISGKDSVIDNVVKVWSSTFNTRSLIARARKGLPLDYDPIGVAVLKMVNAKAAGIMFTAEPTSADASKIIIEGTYGLGENVVSGAVIPDNWVVDATKFEIIERKVLPKTVEHKSDPAIGQTSSPDATDSGQIACLTDEEVIELAKTGKRIEQHFGQPQDIEWAVDSDLSLNNIIILQARPERFRISFRF
jgi:pyruvate,water dikinase